MGYCLTCGNYLSIGSLAISETSRHSGDLRNETFLEVTTGRCAFRFRGDGCGVGSGGGSSVFKRTLRCSQARKVSCFGVALSRYVSTLTGLIARSFGPQGNVPLKHANGVAQGVNAHKWSPKIFANNLPEAVQHVTINQAGRIAQNKSPIAATEGFESDAAKFGPSGRDASLRHDQRTSSPHYFRSRFYFRPKPDGAYDKLSRRRRA